VVLLHFGAAGPRVFCFSLGGTAGLVRQLLGGRSALLGPLLLLGQSRPGSGLAQIISAQCQTQIWRTSGEWGQHYASLHYRRRRDRTPREGRGHPRPGRDPLLSDRLSHGPPELRPRFTTNPLPRTTAGRRLVTGLCVVLVASSLAMVSASAIAEYRGDVAAVLFGGPSPLDVQKRAVPSEPAAAPGGLGSSHISSSSDTSSTSGTSDASATDPSRFSAAARGSLLPLTLLAVGLTGVGFSAVRVRRRTIDAAHPERTPQR
jgi:hypothetical protein